MRAAASTARVKNYCRQLKEAFNCLYSKEAFYLLYQRVLVERIRAGKPHSLSTLLLKYLTLSTPAGEAVTAVDDPKVVEVYFH
jgi:hypothetical protein